MADWLSNVRLDDAPPFHELTGFERFRVAISVMRDDRVGGWMKWVVPVATIVYMVSPANVIPDLQPVVGELDDLFVAALVMAGMMRLIPLIVPTSILNEHIAGVRGKDNTERQ